MAALVLLAGPAPARVVAADLLVLVEPARLDLRRRLGAGVDRILGRLGDAGRHARAGGLRRGGQRARLVGRGAARVGEPAARRRGASAGAPGGCRLGAVPALDLDLDVED